MASFINGVTNYDEWRDHARDFKTYKAKMAVVSEMLAKKNAGIELTFADQIRLVQCIQVSALTGKLEDFYSVSTSVLMNLICQARAKIKGCICEKCYAANNVAARSGLCQALEINFIILNTFLISEDAWATLPIPSINEKARIESHGDTVSEICAINYTRIVNSHKHLFWAIFGKNLEHYAVAFEAEGKPDNCMFVASSPMINVVMEVPEKYRWFVDKVFTVVTPEYAKENRIHINCGIWEGEVLNHKCKLCMRCYNRENKEYYIFELLK